MTVDRLEPVSKATKQSIKYYGAVMVSGEEEKWKCVAPNSGNRDW